MIHILIFLKGTYGKFIKTLNNLRNALSVKNRIPVLKQNKVIENRCMHKIQSPLKSHGKEVIYLVLKMRCYRSVNNSFFLYLWIKKNR